MLAWGCSWCRGLRRCAGSDRYIVEYDSSGACRGSAAVKRYLQQVEVLVHAMRGNSPRVTEYQMTNVDTGPHQISR